MATNPSSDEDRTVFLALGGSEPRFQDDYVAYAQGAFVVRGGAPPPDFLRSRLTLPTDRIALEALGWLEDQQSSIYQHETHSIGLRAYVSDEQNSNIAWGVINFVSLLGSLSSVKVESTGGRYDQFIPSWSGRAPDFVAAGALRQVSYSWVRPVPLYATLAARYGVPVGLIDLTILVRSISEGSVQIDRVDFLVAVGTLAAITSALADAPQAYGTLKLATDSVVPIVEDVWTVSNYYLSEAFRDISSRVQLSWDLSKGPTKDEFTKTVIPLIDQKRRDFEPPTTLGYN